MRTRDAERGSRCKTNSSIFKNHSSQQPARVASGGLDRPDCGPPVVAASSGARGWEGERPLGGWLASSVRRRAERALSCFATLSAQSHYNYHYYIFMQLFVTLHGFCTENEFPLGLHRI